MSIRLGDLHDRKIVRDGGIVDVSLIDNDAGEDFEMLQLQHAGIAADQRPISLRGWVAGASLGAAFWIAFFIYAF